jgi:hypothetical protein
MDENKPNYRGLSHDLNIAHIQYIRCSELKNNTNKSKQIQTCVDQYIQNITDTFTKHFAYI